MSSTTATVEQSIKQRYSSAANEREAALCCPVDYDAKYHIYMSEPYARDIEPIEAYEDIPLSEAAAFDCRRDAVRSPRETKGLEYKATDTKDAPYCSPDGNCC